MMRSFALCIAGVAALLLITAVPLRAQSVEVAPGVQVSKRSYAKAPMNEQPFYGFADKTPEQRVIDEAFVADVTKAAGSREKAFEAATQRAWTMISKSNFSEAAKRFNQAWLLAPEQSAVYHGLAIVAIARFNDAAYAEELFRIAAKQPTPLKALKADYGRFLVIAKRPREAQTVLEQAVVDTPDFADAWSNLGFARLQNGDAKAACEAATKASSLKVSMNVEHDLNILRQQAKCQ